MMVVRRDCRVLNPRGIHCRVATRLAEIVAGHEATVRLEGEHGSADGSSILDILSLALAHDSQVLLTARGPDAGKVATAVESLLSLTSDP